MFNSIKKIISVLFASILLSLASTSSFAIEKLHFVIGGGAGGGWDGTARGTGEAFVGDGRGHGNAVGPVVPGSAGDVGGIAQGNGRHVP